ncbi:TniQ family protein [Streptomyces sp. NPDC048825]|uniref:TniQ family protein n=1 Tax=Streptomyces sp. NPDC048825 TaxID=3365592 RepID=UPI0037156659
MSTALPRRLPVVPVPFPDESLLSWLDHLSSVYGVTRTVAAQASGIMTARDGAARVSATGARSAVFGLGDGDVERVRAATGLEPRVVRRMTWTRVAGRALLAEVDDNDPNATARRTVRASWIDAGEMRFCPACVRERNGRWPLAWCTPWAFACLVHDCYLLMGCPTCRSPVRVGEVSLADGVCRGYVRDPLEAVHADAPCRFTRCEPLPCRMRGSSICKADSSSISMRRRGLSQHAPTSRTWRRWLT